MGMSLGRGRLGDALGGRVVVWVWIRISSQRGAVVVVGDALAGERWRDSRSWCLVSGVMRVFGWVGVG